MAETLVRHVSQRVRLVLTGRDEQTPCPGTSGTLKKSIDSAAARRLVSNVRHTRTDAVRNSARFGPRHPKRAGAREPVAGPLEAGMVVPVVARQTAAGALSSPGQFVMSARTNVTARPGQNEQLRQAVDRGGG
jgi:hypothetical protein